jgi:hypothetical protein
LLYSPPAEKASLLGSLGAIARSYEGTAPGHAYKGFVGADRSGQPFVDRRISGASRVNEAVPKGPDFFLDGL